MPLVVTRWRLPAGSSLPRGAQPLGVAKSAPWDGAAMEEGDAIWWAPRAAAEDPAALAVLLPEPAFGATLVVAESPTTTSLFARIVGRTFALPRAVRGAALLLRGYREVGGGIDPATGFDLIWGRA